MRMSELLNEVRRFELDEGFSPREIKMAIGIASDPRYAKGNMTGAVNAIEKMKKGLSDHPQVAAVLKRQNEDLDEGFFTKEYESGQFRDGNEKPFVDAIKKGGGKNIDVTKPDRREPMLTIEFDGGDVKKIKSLISKVGDGTEEVDEAVSPAQQAAIAISKKEKGEKPKEEGNTFGKELKAARDKGEKTFVVSGKKYNVEDYDVKEEITEKFSDGMIDKLRKAYEPMKGKRIPPAPLMKIFDKIDSNKNALEQLYKADIPFVSTMAMSRLMLKHNYKADQINKLGKIRMEEFELDEAMKQTHIVINSKGKVIGYATDEKGAKDLSKNNIRKEKGAVVKLKNPISDKKAQDMMGGNLTTDMLDKLREEVNLDEAVENILIQKGEVNKIAMQVAKNAKMLGLKSAHMGPHVRIKGAKKQVSNFMSTVIGRSSTGDATSTGMVTPMIDKMLNKSMKEEVELDEKYDLYHKDFSSAMQHAYSYAKSKMGITVDPKEIDSKVATGPKKPTEGKTNKYMLKGKGGNLQIQVYNKGGSKPFELNMYKEENNLIAAAVGHLSND